MGFKVSQIIQAFDIYSECTFCRTVMFFHGSEAVNMNFCGSRPRGHARYAIVKNGASSNLAFI